MKLNSYHNTTQLGGDELQQAIDAAETQEDKILTFFRARPCGNYTPDEVMDLMELKNTPITSVRRAITNLTNLGKLKKTTIQRPGSYGRPAYAWELARETPEQTKLF